MAVGELLAVDGAGDGVPEQEDTQVDLLALCERARQPQRVVGALAAVGLVVDYDENVTA